MWHVCSFYQDKFYRLLTDVAIKENKPHCKLLYWNRNCVNNSFPFIINTISIIILFHHDNARPHIANVITSFSKTEQHNTLPWPALSQNLNSIEQLWNRIDPDVRNQVRKPSTIQELTNAVQIAWNDVHQMDFRWLVLLIRRRYK